MRILHLSDTHLFGDPAARHYGVVDTTAALDRVLDRAETLDRVDLIALTGDLSDDGTAEAYRLLRDRIEPWAAEHGAAVVYAMGNHDGRPDFEEVLGARESVTEIAGFRVVVADSSVPGAGYGAFTVEELDRLRERLADPPENGTVLVLHHPPVPAASALLRALELQRPAEVLEVAAAAGVRLILSGHYHHALTTMAAGIPVVVAPGITNTTDAIAPAGRERAMVGSGFALTELSEQGAPRTLFLTAPGPEDGRVLFDLDPDEVAAIAAAAGPH